MLWHRPENFYPPSEYKNVSPENFISALRQSNLPKKVVEQLDSISQNPTDKIAQFALIDSMLDETHRQYLILMHTVPCELPFSDPRSGIDFYEMEHRISADKVTGSAGDFVIKEFYKKIEGTNFVSIISTGTKLSLTPSGHEFAQWLIDDGRKASYFETSYGKWGEPLPDGPVVEWRRTRAQWQQRNV